MIIDFEYDGLRAKDIGLIPCSIDSSNGTVISSAGSELNLNTVPIRNGTLNLATDTSYDNVLETTFQVCKFNCDKGIFDTLTLDEQRMISRWLNRKSPHPLRLFSDNAAYDYVLFEGSFNLSKIEVSGKLIGYELHFISNRPFAIGSPIKVTINATTTNYTYRLYDESDETGFIYPNHLTIECLEDGDLTITNHLEDRITEIYGCSSGEIIKFDDLFNVSSNMPEGMATHKIQNDFNYTFFRIANLYENRLNIITISKPCKISFDYTPVIKGVGL